MMTFHQTEDPKLDRQDRIDVSLSLNSAKKKGRKKARRGKELGTDRLRRQVLWGLQVH